MRQFVDITGHRFGRLVVEAPTDRRRHGQMVWMCRCDCGEMKEIARQELVQGKTRSCGCLRRDLTVARNKSLKGRLAARGPCDVEDCSNTAQVRGLCKPHYHAEWRSRRLQPPQRDPQIRLKYGISPERYREMAEQQGNTCAICARTVDYLLYVDHDHACCPGQRTCGTCIRALLCRECNFMIGLAKENPETLAAASRYLLRF